MAEEQYHNWMVNAKSTAPEESKKSDLPQADPISVVESEVTVTILQAQVKEKVRNLIEEPLVDINSGAEA